MDKNLFVITVLDKNMDKNLFVITVLDKNLFVITVSAAEQQGYGVWDKNMEFWTVQTSNLTSKCHQTDYRYGVPACYIVYKYIYMYIYVVGYIG